MTLEYREFDVREVNSEARTVTGIAVPFNETVSVGGYKERVERGAFNIEEHADKTIHLYYGHNHRNGGKPIGLVKEMRDTENGLEIKAQFSESTEEAREVYGLVREGILNKFSVGFEPVTSRKDNDVVVRTKGLLREVSIVAMPAYANAAVSEVREDSECAEQNTNTQEKLMSDNTNAPEFVTRDEFSEMERKLAVYAEGNTSAAKEMKYRSYAEFVKGLADGSSRSDNEMITRAFTGATTTDSNIQPAWVNRNIRLVDENRDILNLFSKAPLPSTGMTVTLPVLGSTTGTVGVQAAEGDDLPYLEVVIDDQSFTVKTYGGYSSLSRQAIERSDVPYLQKVLEYQALQYAKATNAAVRSALVAASGTNTATLAADTAAGWIDLVVDSVGLIDTNGFGASAEVMLVSKDVYKRIAHMVDSAGRPLFEVNSDGVNTIGSVRGTAVRGVRGNIAGLPVAVDNGLASNSVWVVSAEALTVMESAGAPFRLQDENIINLTKDFSLYGYLAVGVTNAKAIVKVDADLT